MNLYTFLLFFLLSAQHFAQTWEPRLVQYASTMSGTYRTQTALDFDDNGRPDILYGNYNRRELFLLRNNEDGILQPESLTDSLYSVAYLHATDFNEDGLDDFIIAASTVFYYDAIFLCLNQGNDQFEWIYVCYSPYEGLQDMVVNDFDGDGDNDIVFDDYANSNVIWTVSNDGNNVFTQTFVEYTGQPTRLYGMADLDDDGDEDLMTSYYSFSESAFVLVALENAGNMEFIMHENEVLTGSGNASLGQFVGDDLPDMMFAHSNGVGNVIIYQNNGNFNFSISATTVNTPAYAMLGPTLDYDNDGDDDVFSYQNNTLSIIRHQSNGSYQIQTLSADCNSDVLSYQDFNGDENEDIALTGLELLEGTAGGSFTNVYSNFLPAVAQIITANIDGTPNKDFITIASGGQISIFDQTYNELVDYAEDVWLTGANIDYSTPLREVIPFDKDGDGDDDLLCHIYTYIYWLVNDNGTFTQQTVDNDANGYSLWVGYLDNDLNHDILFHDDVLRRREWNGNSYTTTSFPYEVSFMYEVMDVDVDGDNDIIYIYYNESSNYELKFMQNNNGSFSAQPLFTLDDYLPAGFSFENFLPMSKSDLDQDGDDDLILSSQQSEFIVWFRNDGSNNFTTIMLLDQLNAPGNFDVGDIDLDNDNDIVISNRGDGELIILENDGASSFTPDTLRYNLSYPETIRAVDMDNDSDLDILYSSIVDRRIGWLKNPAYDCPRSYSSESASICEGDEIQFGDEMYSIPGTYGDTLTSYTGCDSVHVLLLQYYQPFNTTITQTGTTLSITGTFPINQWYLNDVLLDGETEPTLNAAEYGNGDYSVTITSLNGCVYTSDVFTVTNIVSVQNTTGDRLSIYPNPCEDIITLNGLSVSEIRIYDMTSRLCHQQFIQSGGNGAIQLDISILGAGQYTMEVRDYNERVTQTLFIKK